MEWFHEWLCEIRARVTANDPPTSLPVPARGLERPRVITRDEESQTVVRWEWADGTSGSMDLGHAMGACWAIQCPSRPAAPDLSKMEGDLWRPGGGSGSEGPVDKVAREALQELTEAIADLKRDMDPEGWEDDACPFWGRILAARRLLGEEE